MKRSPSTFLGCVLCLLLAHCSRAPAETPLSLQEARALALSSPGASAEAKRMAQLQSQAKGNDSAEAWVALGDGWMGLARATQDAGHSLSADASGQLALSLSPGHADALALQAQARLHQHRFADARTLAEASLNKEKDNLRALGVLSDVLLELGQVEASAAAAQRLMDAKPNLASYGRAAYLRWLTGDVAAAKEFIRLAIRAGSPKDREPLAWALTQAAHIFWHAGDLDGAEAGFKAALEKLPNYAPALAGQGRVQLARGDAPGAAETFEAAYRQSRTVEMARALGDAHARAGNDRAAAAAHSELRRQGKEDALTLGMFLADRGEELPYALKLLSEERKARPNVYVQDAHAWALYRAGRLKEARAASDKALSWGTRDARLWFHWGAIALAQGEVAAGREKIEAALKLNPHFDVESVKEARALLHVSETTHAVR